MSVPFSAVLTPESLVFVSPDGKTHTVAAENPLFDSIRGVVREIRQFIREHGAEPAEMIARLLRLCSPGDALVAATQGCVSVKDGVVMYKGEPVRNSLTDRILWCLEEQEDALPYMGFLDNVMLNPSSRSVEQLYDFVERHRMGISDDGSILAYKRVRSDLLDIYSGTFLNEPGAVIEMPRNRVNDDPHHTCSYGLHVCAQSYLPSYGMGSGSRIVIVKVHPRDVVSVPVDYHAAKMRVCRYEVLGEYLGSDREDMLATRPVFQDADFRETNRMLKVGDIVEYVADDERCPFTMGEQYVVAEVQHGHVKVDHVTDHDGDRERTKSDDGLGILYPAEWFELVERPDAGASEADDEDDESSSEDSSDDCSDESSDDHWDDWRMPDVGLDTSSDDAGCEDFLDGEDEPPTLTTDEALAQMDAAARDREAATASQTDDRTFDFTNLLPPPTDSTSPLEAPPAGEAAARPVSKFIMPRDTNSILNSLQRGKRP